MGVDAMQFTVNVADDAPIQVVVGDASFTAHRVELNLVPKDDRHLLDPFSPVRPEDLVEEWTFVLQVRPDEAGRIRVTERT